MQEKENDLSSEFICIFLVMENNEEFCKRYFTVRFSDCDYNSRVKLSSLFRFMEESAVADYY